MQKNRKYILYTNSQFNYGGKLFYWTLQTTVPKRLIPN